MLNFLKKRLRREHIKLVKQNQMASEYLVELVNLSTRAGFPEDSTEYETKYLLPTERHLNTLKFQDNLGSETGEALEIHKELHREYDSVLVGRKVFIQQFGTLSREPLLPFDKVFTPDGGWKAYIESFGEAVFSS